MPPPPSFIAGHWYDALGIFLSYSEDDVRKHGDEMLGELSTCARALRDAMQRASTTKDKAMVKMAAERLHQVCKTWNITVRAK